MQTTDVIGIVYKGLYMVLMLSLPAIVIAATVGTIFAVFQALTQIQEQTLSFAVKLIATLAALVLTLRWTGIEILQYTRMLFEMIPMICG